MNLTSAIAVGAAVLFGFLYFNEDKAHEDTRARLNSTVEAYEYADSAYLAAEKENSNLRKDNDSLEVDLKKLRKMWWDQKEAKQEIEKKYDSLKSGVDNLPVESLAEYIIDHYAGDNYELLGIDFVEDDSSVYIAFQDVTVRDIATTHIDYRRQEEVIDNMEGQINQLAKIKDTQAEKIGNLEDINDNLELQIDRLKESNEHYKEMFIEYEQEAIRQRRLKVLGFSVAAVEGLVILGLVL